MTRDAHEPPPPKGAPPTSHVAHIVDSIAEEAAGPSYSVPSLCRGLRQTPWRPSLLTIGETGADERRGFPHRRFGVDLSAAPVLEKMRFSKGLRAAIDVEAASGATLHAHGLWLMANVYPGWSARRYGARLVISPRGMLGAAALNFSKSQKQAMWLLLQGRAAKAAALFHATSDEEFLDVRRFGLKQPVAVIRNGIDVPQLPAGVDEPPSRKLLYLGRIHPKKGLDKLIVSWRRAQDAMPDCELVIAGPSERGHGEELQKQTAQIGAERVTFPGPLYGEAKIASYRSAAVFVMPTLNENFGMTVAESLALGVPVICTKGAPWSGLVTHDCGWWIDGDPDAIAAAMLHAMELPADKLRDMGARGRSWMQEEFSWSAIATEMAQVYDWLQGAEGLPACVRLY